MINNLIKYFEGKKVLILGFGREGQSTYKLIRKYLKKQKLYISDRRKIEKDSYDIIKDDNNLEIITGDGYLENLEKYDVIMKSPGIPFVGVDTKAYISKVKSQLELLLEFFNIRTIGITGTKGKSTTSSLIYTMLKDQNIDTMLLGNIGTPVFDHIDDIKENMTIVLEMSSHQLEYMEKSPNISILLNLYEEHLDHYESFNKYAEAKCNIYKYQNESDFFLYDKDNETLNNFVKGNIAKTYNTSLKNKESNIYIDESYICKDNKKLYNINEERNLIGDYNLKNIMFVLGVSEILGLDIKKTTKSINEFKTLEHRLELVGRYDGVLYYDNTIATIPVATIEAIKALGKVNTLIIGGMDRGIDYSEFIEFLNSSDIENIICMPKTGHDIAKELSKEKAVIVNTLEEAVERARILTKRDGVCLLSPAAASYGFFKNFDEKGKLFKELVRK